MIRTLPSCFEVTAWSESREIMGIRHREYNLEGVQFHRKAFSANGARAAGQFP
ncbi:glutamine amidotransferase-related protein [Shigella flexneri]